MAASSFVPLAALTIAGRPDWGSWALLGSIAAAYGRPTTPGRRLRVQATAGLLLVALVASGTALAAATVPPPVLVLCTVGVAGVTTLVADAGRWTPPGCLFPVFVFGACISVPVTRDDVAPAALFALAGLVWTLVVTAIDHQVTRRFRLRVDGDRPVAATMPRPTARLTAVHAVVCCVAVGMAGAVALWVGIDRPAWAMVAAVVPVVGTTTHGQLLRVGQRLIRTLLGVS